MNETQTIQVLRLTVRELSSNMTEALATKNLLSVQLTEANQTITELQAIVAELETLLAEQTEPAEEGEE